MIKNNHGWGLREMLFLSSILFIAVLVVAFLVNKLYDGLVGTPTTSDTARSYQAIEENLKSAAKRYYRQYKNEVGEIILSNELLDVNYLTESKLTYKEDLCEGYVMIVDNNFIPFITCDNYETEGY